jgi:hypothetical protein
MQNLWNMSHKIGSTAFYTEIRNEGKEISARSSCALCSCHSLLCPFVLNLNYMNFIELNLCWTHNRTLLCNCVALFWSFYVRDILTMKTVGLTIYWCFRCLIARRQIRVTLRTEMCLYVFWGRFYRSLSHDDTGWAEGRGDSQVGDNK